MLRHYWDIALRNFARFRTSTCINILCLALGLFCFVGAMAAVEYVRSSDSQWSNADRIALITQRIRAREDGGLDTGVLSKSALPVARYLALDVPQLQAVTHVRDVVNNIAVSTGERSAHVKGAATDPEFFRIFPMSFAEGDPNAAFSDPTSIVLTADVARRLFGSESALGRRVVLESEIEATVTGVLDPIPQPSQFGSSATNVVRFEMLMAEELFANLGRRAFGRPLEDLPEANQWGATAYFTYALLPESYELADLNRALERFGARRVAKERLAHADYQFAAIPVADVWLSNLDETTLRGSTISIAAMLQLLGAIVLAMSCLNYANAITAQAVARTKETGMRKVLGASRIQTILQATFEAGLITLMALVVAVLMLVLAAGVLSGVLNINPAVLLTEPAKLFAFLLALALLVSSLSGLYPGWVLARTNPMEALRLGKARLGPALLPKILVGIQFGAASLLLISVGVIYSQNAELRRRALSTEVDPVVVIGNELRVAKVDFEVLKSALLKHPSIKSVSSLSTMPWNQGGVGVDSLLRSKDEQSTVEAMEYIVSSDFLDTLGIPLLAGRTFDTSRTDDLMGQFGKRDPNRNYSILLDRSTAALLGWTNPTDAVNQIVYLPLSRYGSEPDQPLRVIGVVADKSMVVSAPASGVSSAIYMLMPGVGYPLVRIDRNDVPGALAAIDETWRKLKPDLPVARRFMDELFERTYATYERLNRVTTMLAVAAFAIAAIGLFGMASFVASRRIHEVGVRKTLGAKNADVVSMLLKDFSQPVLIANLAAWPIGYVASQAYISIFLDRIDLGPGPFIASLLITLAIAWIAVGGQTLRAARLNPATVLRYE